MSSPVLTEVLERLGLSSYFNVLVANGFREWETVIDITEEDLKTLRFKLGHRRALQREIATYRGLPTSLSLADLESEGTSRGQHSLSTSALESLSRQISTPHSIEKRRYRRHPRPDHNAPKKPKTAYVNFADHLRTDSEIRCLSFVDIAKEVGRRWQILPVEKKCIWESHAARSTQQYEAQMGEYRQTDLWRKYHTYLTEFKAQQAPSIPEKCSTSSRASSFAHEEYSHGSSSSSQSPVSVPSSILSVPKVEVNHSALTLAFGELVSLRGDMSKQSERLYDAQHLPAEDLAHRAMYACVRSTGSLLYMWTYSQVDDILDRIYRPEQPVDALTLAECFIATALGTHCDTDSCPEQIRRLLYASATTHFHEKMAHVDYLRTMRLLLSLALYAMLEKHLAARYLVAAGIQIGRWKFSPPCVTECEGDKGSWRRTFRSLLFMDCWLSYTLGYPSDVSADDISMAGIHDLVDLVTIDELTHIQTSKIGLIASEINKTLESPELITRKEIQVLIGKLETWRVQVPPMLQISTSTNSNLIDLTLYQRRAVFKVHILYFGALILVYRYLLTAIATTSCNDGAAWTSSLSVDDAKKYRNECTFAAQQIARILGLMTVDGKLPKRCWLIIYWAFTACVALLCSATTKLLDGLPETAHKDVTLAKACLTILEACQSHEPVADRYVKIVGPLYDHVRDVHQRILGRAKTSISSLLEADPNTMNPPIPVSKTEISPVSEKLAVLLADPFGRKQGLENDETRRVVDQDGSCLVFWWK